MEQKIAFSTVKGGINDVVTEVFGRCSRFTIVTVRDGSVTDVEIIDNAFASHAGGVGIAVSQELAKKGVNVVITGRVGFNAMEVLKKAGIEAYNGANLRVEDALKKFLNGEFERIVEGGKGGKGGRGGMGRGRGMGMGVGVGMGKGWQ